MGLIAFFPFAAVGIYHYGFFFFFCSLSHNNKKKKKKGKQQQVVVDAAGETLRLPPCLRILHIGQ